PRRAPSPAGAAGVFIALKLSRPPPTPRHHRSAGTDARNGPPSIRTGSAFFISKDIRNLRRIGTLLYNAGSLLPRELSRYRLFLPSFLRPRIVDSKASPQVCRPVPCHT